MRDKFFFDCFSVAHLSQLCVVAKKFSNENFIFGWCARFFNYFSNEQNRKRTFALGFYGSFCLFFFHSYDFICTIWTLNMFENLKIVHLHFFNTSFSLSMHHFGLGLSVFCPFVCLFFSLWLDTFYWTFFRMI